jgi:lysophospholipase L1-like esterase
VPLKQFNHNIQTLINQAKKLTEKIFIVGLTPVDESKVHPVLRNTEKSYTNEQIHLYDQQLQTLCTQENIPFLSMQNVLEKADLDDGLHPNAQGHQKIFEKVWNELFKLFF